MRIDLTRDVERFAADAEDYLAERIERNVLATVLMQVRRSRVEASPPLFACRFDGRGRLCGVALRTPPRPMLASGFDASAADLLIERWLREDPSPAGVSAQPETARAIAAAWRNVTGGHSRCTMRAVMHVLTAVDEPPRPARGRLRIASEEERELLIEWERAFLLEAGVDSTEDAEAAVAGRLEIGAQRVWEDGGPACTLALARAVAGTVRIGPVYTPPERRNQGYASSAVAAACRLALAMGARRCMLFTDIANPTSNKIYANVGFRPFAEWENHLFENRQTSRQATDV